MSVLLQSSSGGGRGPNCGHNSHLPIRHALLIRSGDLSASHHDIVTKSSFAAGRTLCDELEIEAARSYRQAHSKLMHDLLETGRSHLMLRDNNNPQRMSKHITIGGISKSIDAIAGCDTSFSPCFQSRDETRPPANTQFLETIVRHHIESLGDNPNLESAEKISPIQRGDFIGDKNDDPHVSDYILMPPLCGKSSDRSAFEKFLVDDNRTKHGEQYRRLNIEPSMCADPEFDLRAAAITASNFDKVRDWIIFYACWHCAMHLMKCIFGDVMNLIHFFSVLFTEHLPYRKDHWKSTVKSIKAELAELKKSAERQRADAAKNGENSEEIDSFLR